MCHHTVGGTDAGGLRFQITKKNFASFDKGKIILIESEKLEKKIAKVNKKINKKIEKEKKKEKKKQEKEIEKEEPL